MYGGLFDSGLLISVNRFQSELSSCFYNLSSLLVVPESFDVPWGLMSGLLACRFPKRNQSYLIVGV